MRFCISAVIGATLLATGPAWAQSPPDPQAAAWALPTLMAQHSALTYAYATCQGHLDESLKQLEELKKAPAGEKK